MVAGVDGVDEATLTVILFANRKDKKFDVSCVKNILSWVQILYM